MSSRKGRDNGVVGNTEARDAVNGKARVDYTALLPRKHGRSAARVHQRLDDVVPDVLGKRAVLSDVSTGRDLDSVDRLPGVGGVEAAEVVDIRNQDLKINGVGSGGVVDDGRSIVIRLIEKDSAAAERLEEERSLGAGGEGGLHDGMLGVLKSLRDDLKLGEMAGLDGLGCAGGEVRKSGSVLDLCADVGDDLLGLGGDVREGDVGGAVAHGKRIRAAGGPLAELGDHLSGKGSVALDVGQRGVRSIV